MLYKKVIYLAVFISICLSSISHVMAFEFSAFGDSKFSVSDGDRNADNAAAFAIGGLDLFVQQEIDKKTLAFVDFVFENDGEGFVLDVERLYVERDINKSLRIGAGRFHSPIGVWNRTFHHGVLMQNTYSRPSFLDFEDGAAAILPTHVVGVLLDGIINENARYEFAVANSTFVKSQSFEEIGIANTSDLNDHKTVFFRTVIDFDSVYTSLGLFGMSNDIIEADKASSIDVGNRLISQYMAGMDISYTRNKITLLSEAFYFRNTADKANVFANNDTSTHKAIAGYSQISYQYSANFRPTYRFEYLNFEDGQDLYFSILGTTGYSAHVLALRYDLDDSNAVTLELKSSQPDTANAESVNTLTLDWAFLLF